MKWIAILLFSVACTSSQVELIVLDSPAEYEEQEALWMIWPTESHFRGDSIQYTIQKMIEAVVPYQKVMVTWSDSSQLNEANHFLKGYLKHPNLQFLQIPSVQLWSRDMGGIFVKTNKGMAIADFSFNAWGYSGESDEDAIIEEKYDENVAQALSIPVLSSRVISEGGNREINESGVMLSTLSVELGRNPGMDKNALEKEYKRLLGIKKVLWLEQGLYEDDHSFKGPFNFFDSSRVFTPFTTNGHVDEFARFVNDSTILLAQVAEDEKSPLSLENQRRMERNFEIIAKAKNINNKPFKIIRIPLPKPIVRKLQKGDPVYDYLSELEYEKGFIFPKDSAINVIAAASYLNFTITNKVILFPYYTENGNAALSEQALMIIKECFPKRKIIPIDPIAINFGGGGMHCITQHQAK